MRVKCGFGEVRGAAFCWCGAAAAATAEALVRPYIRLAACLSKNLASRPVCVRLCVCAHVVGKAECVLAAMAARWLVSAVAAPSSGSGIRLALLCAFAVPAQGARSATQAFAKLALSLSLSLIETLYR